MIKIARQAGQTCTLNKPLYCPKNGEHLTITANHHLNNLDNRFPGQDIIIGKNCWIGINSVILTGVRLGDHMVAATCSVVGKNKKFEKGY